MIISAWAARSEPARVGLKSFSIGIGALGWWRCQTSIKRRVVYSYSPVFHSASPALGKWYLQEGATNTDTGVATDKASSKNSRYLAKLSYQPRPFHETVQPW